MEFLDWKSLLGSIFTFLQSQAFEILISLCIIFLVWKLFVSLTNQFVHEDRRRFKLKKNSKYTTVAIAFVWILLLYSNHSNNNESFPFYIFGIFLAGVAFSMRDIFSNFVGWMMVASHNGFQNGDRIEIGDIRGDVIDMGVLRTVIAEIGDWDERGEHSTGRLVSIPNSKVLTEAMVNYNRGFETLWNEISVIITFESDWKKAEQILEDIAAEDYEMNRERFLSMMKKVQRDFMVTYTFLSPKVYVTIVESGVKLTLRHMVEVRKRRTATDLIFREILTEFNQNNSIQLAYPTTRFYNSNEGV